MKGKTCGCKSMRSGGQCMKCGGTAKHRLGGVIKFFADGGTVTAAGSGGGGAGGGGGTTTGMAGAASTGGGKTDVMSDIARLRQAKMNGVTVEEEKALNEEFRTKYGEESMMALIAGNAISEGRYINQAAGDGFAMDGSEAYKKFGIENAKQDAKNYGNSVGGKALTEVANYIQGKKDDLSPDIVNILTMPQGDVLGDYKTGKKAMTTTPTGTGGAMGVGNKVTTGVEDKSLPNWGRAKTQQAMLNKLIEADKSADKPQMLKEDDVIGPKTLEVMQRYEKSGLYKRPALFSDENLKQYKKNVTEGIKIKPEGAKVTTEGNLTQEELERLSTEETNEMIKAFKDKKAAFELSNEEYGKIAQESTSKQRDMRQKEFDEMTEPYSKGSNTEEGYRKYNAKIDEYYEKYPGEYQEHKRKYGDSYLTEKDKRIKEGTIGRLGSGMPTEKQPTPATTKVLSKDEQALQKLGQQAYGALSEKDKQALGFTKPKTTAKPTQKYGDMNSALNGMGQMGQGLGNIIEGVGSGLSSGFTSMMDYASKNFTEKELSKEEEEALTKELRSLTKKGIVMGKFSNSDELYNLSDKDKKRVQEIEAKLFPRGEAAGINTYSEPTDDMVSTAQDKYFKESGFEQPTSREHQVKQLEKERYAIVDKIPRLSKLNNDASREQLKTLKARLIKIDSILNSKNKE